MLQNFFKYINLKWDTAVKNVFHPLFLICIVYKFVHSMVYSGVSPFQFLRIVQICVLTECQKYAWTKLPDVCQYMGKKKPAGIKLQYFCQYGDRKKKNNQRTKLNIYILDTIESESTTRFKNRSSDRMMMSN